MTKIISFLLLFCFFTACQKKDINALKNRVNELESQLAQLKQTTSNLNNDLKALQAIATALQAKVSVVSYIATATGYELVMSDGSKINLTHGKDGANGTNGKDGVNAPVIGLKQDTDGNYYWTIGKDWLLQNGQKVKANGTNGTNGTNGADGTTPLLMVNTTSNQWMVSYDNGNTWSTIKDGNGNPITATGAQGPQGQPGQTGPQGPAGVSNFSITETETSIIITYNSHSYTLFKTGAPTICNMGDLPSIPFRGLTVILSNDAKGLLSSAAQRMKSNPDCKIIVKGYNCNTSLAERQRSWDRVNNIINHLVQNEGISANRLIFQYSQSGGNCGYVDLAGANQNQAGGGIFPPRP